MKGKYLDNLEFMQWMKRYFDTHASGAPYDAPARRAEASKKGGKPLVPAAASALPVVQEKPAKVASAVVNKTAKPSVAAAAAGGEMSAKVREYQNQVLLNWAQGVCASI